MQVEFNPINAVTKEINITVPLERANKEYQKYLRKAARDVAIPGFRKGKAPLAMVERMHSETIMDYFYKEIVDVIFDEVVEEHEVHFLLFPEVKDVIWEKDTDMKIKIEIEHEPTIEFKQLEGLSIPHKPKLLEDEVAAYLDNLRQEHSRIMDVETAIENDNVDIELTFSHGSESFTRTGSFLAGTETNFRSLEVLMGCKTGDKLETKIDGRSIMLATREPGLNLEHHFMYPCQIIVNSITRQQLPELDDEFAKDMEFDSLEQMKQKIADDMRLRNEHLNINIDCQSVVGKLFVDNNFDIPNKTIEYLAKKEAEKIDNPEYRKYYEYQYSMQIAQELVTMYIMNNLRKAMPMEVSPEMLEEYYTHEAILEDISVEAYKDSYSDEINTEEFKHAVQNYFILRQICQNSSFFVAEEPTETEIPEAELIDQETTEE
ncbi:MAG: trigger factor [Candidatus Cloacimonetes bacterium]|nr:trigger factor [Candidatus Cloacimonadota bacterium]